MTGEWGAGREFRDNARARPPGDLATIIYTSGTTGEPKGRDADAREPRRRTCEAARRCWLCRDDDVALSFLPLSHAFERMVSFIYLLTGVHDHLCRIDRDDCARHRDACGRRCMTGVPRVYEKLQARIMDGRRSGSGSERRSIFRWAVKAGMARARAHLARPVARAARRGARGTR